MAYSLPVVVLASSVTASVVVGSVVVVVDAVVAFLRRWERVVLVVVGASVCKGLLKSVLDSHPTVVVVTLLLSSSSSSLLTYSNWSLSTRVGWWTVVGALRNNIHALANLKCSIKWYRVVVGAWVVVVVVGASVVVVVVAFVVVVVGASVVVVDTFGVNESLSISCNQCSLVFLF